MKRIGLKEAIEALRDELGESILTATHKSLQFEVGEIELEFKVQMELSIKGTTKISFWVVDIDGGGSRSSSTTHTIRIPLRPVTKNNQPVLTGSNIAPE